MASAINGLAQQINAIDSAANLNGDAIRSGTILLLGQLRNMLESTAGETPYKESYEGLVKVPGSCIGLLEKSNNPQETLAVVQIMVDLLSTTVSNLERKERQTRNTFRNINMSNRSLLALMSPNSPGTFSRIHTGNESIQYIHMMADHGIRMSGIEEITDRTGDELIAQLVQQYLPSSISRFRRTSPALERKDTNHFHDICLQEREVMLILSSAGPITVEDVSGKEGSVLIAGQIALPNISLIARTPGVSFDDNESDGIFQSLPIG